MTNTPFYIAVLERNCQAKYFTSLVYALKYLEEEYNKTFVEVEDPIFAADMNQLYKEHQIDDFGWIEECYFKK